MAKECKVGVNIYASSVAKDVFQWIVLIVLTITSVWTMLVVGGMIRPIGVPGVVLTIVGPALFALSLLLSYIFLIFWKPYKHFDDVNSDKLNQFICENKKK